MCFIAVCSGLYGSDWLGDRTITDSDHQRTSARIITLLLSVYLLPSESGFQA